MGDTSTALDVYLLIMFGDMSNLVLKHLLRFNVIPNVCPVAQICSYRQRSEQMGKRASNIADVDAHMWVSGTNPGFYIWDVSIIIYKKKIA